VRSNCKLFSGDTVGHSGSELAVYALGLHAEVHGGPSRSRGC
jgi:hypothetical protein